MSNPNNLLNQDLTLGNFGDWTKAYVEDLSTQLNGKFNNAVATETMNVVDLAQSKITSANQEAQLAFEAMETTNKKAKMLMIVAVAIFLVFYFSRK